MTELFRTSSVRRIQGFTLIEFAIVLTLSAFMLAAGLQFYRIYTQNQYYDQTYAKLENVNNMLVNFNSSTAGRMPCPSDPSLNADDPMFGVEDCAKFQSIAVGSNFGGMYKVAGMRTTLADPLTIDKDRIYIGGVPFKTLQALSYNKIVALDSHDPLSISMPCYVKGDAAMTPVFCDDDYDGILDPQKAPLPKYSVLRSSTDIENITADMISDAFGYQFTYAVTANFTTKGSWANNNQFGTIRIISAKGGTSISTPVDSAQFVVLSHGIDHNGAYNTNHGKASKVAVACNYVTTHVDIENCNNDGTFLEGVRLVGSDATVYNDDVAEHSDFSLTNIWAGVGSLYNVNPRNVGIGTTTAPTAKLELRTGTTSAGINCITDPGCTQHGALKGNTKIIQPKICDDTGSCFDVNVFGGSTATAGGTMCDQSGLDTTKQMRVVTGLIGNGGVDCKVVVSVPSVTPTQACGAGQYITGFKVDGSIQCASP